MLQSAKLARRCRGLLEGQLKAIEKELKSPALSPLRRADLIEDTTRILETLNRSVENSGRLLTAKHAPAIPTDDGSVDRVMQDLIRGQAKGAGR